LEKKGNLEKAKSLRRRWPPKKKEKRVEPCHLPRVARRKGEETWDVPFGPGVARSKEKKKRGGGRSPPRWLFVLWCRAGKRAKRENRKGQLALSPARRGGSPPPLFARSRAHREKRKRMEGALEKASAPSPGREKRGGGKEGEE